MVRVDIKVHGYSLIGEIPVLLRKSQKSVGIYISPVGVLFNEEKPM